MKKKTLIDERNELLINSIHQINRDFMQSGRHVPIRIIAEMAERKTAPRFFIGLQDAINNTNAIIKGRELKIKSPLKRQMYRDIYERYMQELNSSDVKEFKSSIIERVINSEAPRYYVEPKNINRLIYRYYSKMRAGLI